MSLQSKLIIPLCDKRLKKEFLSQESGFIDAYTWDLNAYWLEDHMMLVYEYDLDTVQKIKRYEYFKKLGYKPKSLKINNKWVTVYVIKSKNGELRDYRTHGYLKRTTETIKSLLDFWGTDENDVFDIAIYGKPSPNFEETILQEVGKCKEYKNGFLITQKNPSNLK